MEELKSMVIKAQTGDLEAFSGIVRRFQDMAYGYAYSTRQIQNGTSVLTSGLLDRLIPTDIDVLTSMLSTQKAVSLQAYNRGVDENTQQNAQVLDILIQLRVFQLAK